MQHVNLLILPSYSQIIELLLFNHCFLLLIPSPQHALSEAGPSNSLRCSIQFNRNDLPDLPFSPFYHSDAQYAPMMYILMECPAVMSVVCNLLSTAYLSIMNS